MRSTTKPDSTPRRPLARHARLRTRHPVLGVLRGLAVAVVVVVMSAVGVGAYAVTDITQSFAENTVEFEGAAAAPAPGLHPYEGEFNLLLVGTDECEKKYIHLFPKRCSGKELGNRNNDVNLLVHISAEQPRRVTVISFPRDLYVEIPSCKRDDGSMSSPASRLKINTTYATGGPSCVAKTIEKLTHIKAGYAAAITWGGVIELTDAVGGVDVCVAQHLRDSYTHLDLQPGKYNVKGKFALQFLRTRHGLNEGGDRSRISNQQQYMSNLVKKMTSDDTLNDPAKLYMLATAAVGSIKKSPNLTNPSTIVQLALVLKQVDLDQIVFVQYPTHPKDGGLEADTWSADKLFAAIKKNQPLKPSDSPFGSVKQDAAPVAKPKPTATTAPATAAPTGTPAPQATVAPTDLGTNTWGTTAADTTCSAGRVD